MLKPLQNWFCDTCDEVIKSPQDGWIEWLTDENNKSSGFTIIHHCTASPRRTGDCSHYRDCLGLQDAELRYFLGPEGLNKLYGFLDYGPRFARDYTGPNLPIPELRPFTDFCRRLTIPYYEEARLYWQQAMQDGFYDEIGEEMTYCPKNCKRTIENYGA